MNPLINLIGKEFQNLNTSEMCEVVNACFDSHRFNFFADPNKFNNSEEVIRFFQSVAYTEYDLKMFFDEWTK
jgi:hypothetical protein